VKLAIDTETTGLRAWHGDTPFLVGISTEDGLEECLRWRVDPETREVLYEEEPPDWFVEMLQSEDVEKVFFNATFDMRMMEHGLGLVTKGPVHDVMISAHVFNNLETGFALKPLSKKYLGIQNEDEEELKAATIKARREAKDRGWKRGPNVYADYWMPHELWGLELDQKYCMLDVERTALLHLLHINAMEDQGLMEVYEREMELLNLVYRMEEWGMCLDLEAAKEEREKCKQAAKEQLEELRRIAKNPKLNPRSPNQLAKFLFDDLELPVKERTGTGKPSTARKALEGIEHPVIQLLTHYQTNSRSVSTFYDKYMSESIPTGHKNDAIIHPSFHQCGARTARFSCRNPNLQNAPNTYLVRAELPSHVRRPFKPRPGHCLWFMDYSQLELRLFAEIAGVEPLIEVIERGDDPHHATANAIWGGEGNPLGIRAAINVLKLNENGEVSEEIKEARRLASRHAAVLHNDSPELRRYRTWWNSSAFQKNLIESGHAGLTAILEECQPVAVRNGKLVISGPDYFIASLRDRHGKLVEKSLGVQCVFIFQVPATSAFKPKELAAAWLDYYDWDIVKAELSVLQKSVSRERTKTLSYAKQYGGGVSTIAEAVKIPEREAKQFLTAYAHAYPRIDLYANELMNEASQVGYITNPYGRRLHVPGDKLYVCMNYMVQSTAADMLKTVMLKTDRYAQEHNLDGQIVLNLHDEMVTEWKQDTDLRHIVAIRDIMEDHGGLFRLDMPVDIEYTLDSWEKKRKLKL